MADEALLEEVMKETVPMTGRCIHPGKGNFKGKGGGESQAYDIFGRVCVTLSLLSWDMSRWDYEIGGLNAGALPYCRYSTGETPQDSC